jgi:hypothetical protein
VGPSGQRGRGSAARRERMGRSGPRAKGEARARAREREREREREEKHGPESAQPRGGGVFPFSFFSSTFS